MEWVGSIPPSIRIHETSSKVLSYAKRRTSNVLDRNDRNNDRALELAIQNREDPLCIACSPNLRHHWRHFLVPARRGIAGDKTRIADDWTRGFRWFRRLPTMSRRALRKLASVLPSDDDSGCIGKIHSSSVRRTKPGVTWLHLQSRSQG